MKRLGILSLFTLLFITFIIIWNNSYESGKEEAYIPLTKEKIAPTIPSEKGVFERMNFALDYAHMPDDKNHQRSLKDYYNNRAFPGAPPYIPHPLSNDRDLGGNSCLKCHQNGGFVSKFNAYAPVSPHPEMENCRQCHVVNNSESLFKGNNFYKLPAPTVGNNNALEGSPPMIPHQIQMRENCLACHAGPAAPIEIKVSHPERSNCRQCHGLDTRVNKDPGIFLRKIDDDE